MQIIFESLKQLALPADDFAVFGSGPLIVRRIIPPANDLDVICRGKAWERIREIGSLQINDDYNVDIVTLCDGRVTFGNSWGIGDFGTDKLIGDAEVIDELPFVKLHYVIAYKLIRRAAKDMRHLDALSRSTYARTLSADDRRLLLGLR